jgi:hypothetical protein
VVRDGFQFRAGAWFVAASSRAFRRATMASRAESGDGGGVDGSRVRRAGVVTIRAVDPRL